MKAQKIPLLIAFIFICFNSLTGIEVQKICKEDTAPFNLLCRSNTGVSIQSVSVQFASVDTLNKECETLISYNITENTRPFQDTCNRAADRSICILDQGYVKSLFQPSTVPSNIYPLPIRLLFIYDCLGLTICYNDYNLTNYNLYCPNTTDFILITNLAGSFKRDSKSIPDCLGQPDFSSNSVIEVISSLCGYCINQSPCIFTRELIDEYKLFSLETFNLLPNPSSKPISVMVQYQCLDQSLYNFYSQSIYCTSSISTSTAISYKTSISIPPTSTTVQTSIIFTTSRLLTLITSSTNSIAFSSKTIRTNTNTFASTSKIVTTATSSFIDYEYYDEDVFCISNGFEMVANKTVLIFLLIFVEFFKINLSF